MSAIAHRLRRRGLHGHRIEPARSDVVKRRVQFSLLVLLTLLGAVLVTGIFAALNLYRSAEDHYVGLALPLRSSVRDVLFQMEREETGVRGYVITGDRSSLAPYFAGRKGVIADLAEIARLTRKRPALADRVREVRSEVLSLHGFYDRLIVFVADGRVGQERARREVLDGESLAERFRRSATALQADTDVLVAETRRAQHDTFLRTIVTLSIAGALALAAGILLLRKLPERVRSLYASEEDARLRAEQGANASRALTHVSDAVLLVDDDDVVRFWNAAAEQLFTTPTRQAVGRAAASVIPDYERLVDAAGRGEQFVPVTVDGDERWLTPSVSSFDGGRVLTLRDATVGYVLERVRSDFVATASHELRTPVTAVYGAAQTPMHEDTSPRPEEQRRLMQMIGEEAERLAQITDQMLVVAQADRGELRLEEAECDVVALCRTVIGQERFRLAGPFTMLLVAPTQMAPVRCDGGKLRQVVLNLVENAVKYSPEGGRVELRVEDGTELVRLQVTDTGLGIPPAEQERVFEKFYRVDAQMSRGIGGSGLGLYISRQIVEQMGGRLTVDSELGRGSTFTVELPLEPQR